MRKVLIFAACAMMFTACGKQENGYDAMGVFEATEVVVSAKAQGEILRLSIDDGDEVRQGDTLGMIDAVKLNLQQQSMEESRGAQTAHILNLQEQTAGIRQQIANLQREHSRFSGLLQKGAATRKQVDDIDNQIKVL